MSKADDKPKQDIVKPTEHEHYQIFERLDEEQISTEVQGAYVKEMVYQFSDGQGRTVTGLSYVGVKALLQTMLKYGYSVVVEPAVVEDLKEEDEYRARCKVIYTAPNGKTLEMWGYTRQPKKIRTKSGMMIPNEFAYVQACSKAQRNAARNVIPEKLATKMIEMFIREGKVRQINPSVYVAPEASKPIDVASKSVTVPVVPPQSVTESKPLKDLAFKSTWFRLTWTINGEEIPVSADDINYGNIVKGKCIPGIEKRNPNATIKEEIVEGVGVVAIRYTALYERDEDDLANALKWALYTSARCSKEAVQVTKTKEATS